MVKTVSLPRRPDAFANHQVMEVPLILTDRRLQTIMQEIEEGKRPPLDHACFTNDEWVDIKRILLDMAAYMRQAEAYFDDIEKQVEALRLPQ